MKRVSVAVAAAVLVTAAATCLVLVALLTPSSTTQPSPRAATASVTEPAATSPTRDATTVAAPPVRLRIPAIGLIARVGRLGLNPDRTVQVPTNPDDTGWYRHGPVPGDTGSAVILGHVDSASGPAVFARLHQLEPGMRMTVEAADGTTSTFRVLRLVTYPNDRFPAEQVYAADEPGRLLNLVTCAGTFDPEDGYQANLVVYTRHVA